MILAEQIAIYLNYLELGIYSPNGIDGNIYIDILPDGEQLISIYNTPGIKSDSKLGYFSAGIQVIYRGNKNPIDSFKIANDIMQALHGFHSDYFAMGENFIVSSLSLNGSPECIGTNKNGNFEYSINLDVDYKI
jgi:hypothetical protein